MKYHTLHNHGHVFNLESHIYSSAYFFVTTDKLLIRLHISWNHFWNSSSLIFKHKLLNIYRKIKYIFLKLFWCSNYNCFKNKSSLKILSLSFLLSNLTPCACVNWGLTWVNYWLNMREVHKNSKVFPEEQPKLTGAVICYTATFSHEPLPRRDHWLSNELFADLKNTVMMTCDLQPHCLGSMR